MWSETKRLLLIWQNHLGIWNKNNISYLCAFDALFGFNFRLILTWCNMTAKLFYVQKYQFKWLCNTTNKFFNTMLSILFFFIDLQNNNHIFNFSKSMSIWIYKFNKLVKLIHTCSDKWCVSSVINIKIAMIGFPFWFLALYLYRKFSFALCKDVNVSLFVSRMWELSKTLNGLVSPSVLERTHIIGLKSISVVLSLISSGMSQLMFFPIHFWMFSTLLNAHVFNFISCKPMKTCKCLKQLH